MNKNFKRFREYGFTVGFLPVGKRNSIADVGNITVGHKTMHKGKEIHTGVTVIDPGVPNIFRDKLSAAISVGNGFGKMTGTTQIEELGTLETPIALTNTLAVGPVMRGVVDLVIQNTKDILPQESVNAVVGETNDGYVNSLHKNIVTGKHVSEAHSARKKDFEFGAVGAGSGTRAFSWKGGIGSSSRVVKIKGKTYTVGTLLQTNFGGALTMLGVPIGEMLGKTDFDSFLPKKAGDGSCMIVIATDAPLGALELKRLANRAFLGLARTGSIMAPGSGDYAIAFSTYNQQASKSKLLKYKPLKSELQKIEGNDLASLFLAVVESVEESVYEALCAGETIVGRDGNTLEKFPMEKVKELLNKYVYEKYRNKK